LDTGAGAAGSSAAHHLRKQLPASHSLNLTIYESRRYIGGRSITVPAYNDPLQPVELGASIFVSVNSILSDAVKEFGLDVNDMRLGCPGGPSEADARTPGLGIWNGEEFVLTQSSEELTWWDYVKLVWKYGTTPYYVQKEMKSTVGKFLGMYDAENGFPWMDLTDQVHKRGLLEQAGFTGEQYLRNKGLWGNGKFNLEILQAATRVNYAQNLGVISGMEALVSIATDGAMSVKGGNWKIFDAFVNASDALIKLGTTVTDISKTEDGQYTLSVKPADDDFDMAEDGPYDEVIIASPYQFTSLNTSNLASEPHTIPYVHLHVTLFTSPHPIDPAYFNLPAETPAPLVILTTLPPSSDPEEPLPTDPTYAGAPGFFSISRLRQVINPHTHKTENLYKIFTPRPVKPEFLNSLLGIKRPPPNTLEEFTVGDISWLFVKEWQSYPVEYPRATFDKIKLEDGLWYTGAMDAFVSTMETNALMGKNVAALMTREWVLGKEELEKSKKLEF
jgi:prenylcysteine oxidase/farnesylcysteine lyase